MTDRIKIVQQMLLEGKTLKECGERFCLSGNTIGNQFKSVVGVRSKQWLRDNKSLIKYSARIKPPESEK